MPHPHRSLLTVTASLTLAACSPPTDSTAPEPVTQKIFSAEEQRIASALSIGTYRSDANASPQYRALLCSLALAAVRARLGDNGALSADQRAALALAQTLFERRFVKGVAPAERNRMRNDLEAAYPEPGDRARFAIRCLRDLA